MVSGSEDNMAVCGIRVGHLVSDFCPSSSPFCYRIVANPNCENAVFCTRRTNRDIYPFDNVMARSLSRPLREWGNAVLPRVGSVAGRLAIRYEWHRFVSRYRPQVLHAQFGDYAATIISAIPTSLPLVVTFHGSDINTATYGKASLSRLRALFDRATISHFVSNDLRNYGVALGCDPVRTRVVYLGTPIPDTPARHSDRVVDCRFACVGRLVPCKGHETLLRAFRVVIDELPSAQLCLFGDGPLRDHLEWLAGELDIESHVSFYGDTPNTKILSRLANDVDVLVLASQTDDTGRREGLPISLTEGAALGLPAVSTVCGGIPEIVRDGESGLLAAERRTDQLSGAMLSLARDPDLRRRLGSQGRDLALKMFNVDLQLAALATLYDEAIVFSMSHDSGVAAFQSSGRR